MDSVVKYGQEIGPNLIKIAKHLIKNDNLLMLLKNTDLDPLNKEQHPEHIDGKKLLNKLICFVPLMTAKEQKVNAKLVIVCDSGAGTTNYDNELLTVHIHVFCPFE